MRGTRNPHLGLGEVGDHQTSGLTLLQELTTGELAWMLEGACNEDPELFYGPMGEKQPTREAREAAAKKICGGCVVQEACAEWLSKHPDRYGVWAGTTESDRRLPRKSRAKSARSVVPKQTVPDADH